MPKVLIPLAQGCEELEAVTIIDLLRRASIDVTSAGLSDGPVTASRGTVLIPDTTLDAVLNRTFDLVVLPGGQPGARHLEADDRLAAMLKRQQAEGRYLGAICAAPKVLAVAGLLNGKTATHYPGSVIAADFPQANFVDLPVVVDGSVVTGRGPGTAMEFALELIELLCGRERRDEVERGLVRAV